MADIELVVKIPEEEYINIKDAINSLIEQGVERASMSKICLSILDGTPLPKGHGRLIDADLLKNQFPIWVDNFSSHVVNNTISKAQTIIEADNEVEK